MKLTFGARTFSALRTFLNRTIAGQGIAGIPCRTAAGQVVAVGLKEAGQVACPWGAAAAGVYIAGAAQGENYA
jgi:hypothetical protein